MSEPETGGPATLEITEEMIAAGVAALSFWLDGAGLVVGEMLQSQAVASVYSAMARETPHTKHEPTTPLGMRKREKRENTKGD
jgi:hypothetical protein